jgi:uncharacterized protein YyaL (SSP411 family)
MEEKWLENAEQLLTYTLSHFFNKDSGMFYYTSDVDPVLITRNSEVIDNVIPSSNSVMAKNLFMLGQYFYKEDYIEKSKKMLNNVKRNIFKYGAYCANWDILLAWFAGGHYELAIAGKDFEAKRKEFDKHYLPDVFFSGGLREGTLPLLENKMVEGQTTIYLCRDKVCKSPATDVKEVLKHIFRN